MSKSEWEAGSLVIPAAAWPTFRRSLIEKWNAEQDRLLQLAVKLRGEVDAAAKGKRGFDRAGWLRTRMNAGHWGEDGASARSDDYEEVLRLIGLQPACNGPHGAWTTPTKTCAPKRKDLKILPVSRGAVLDLGEAAIKLDDTTHTVSWRVQENNHARDCARSLPMARALFGLLARVEWTRGSGGKIVGNDEYNSDGEDEGGGSNYVTAAYGPLGGR